MPTGVKLGDGQSTKIGFANAPNIALWEKTVTPPGVDGGGPNDQTTMRNIAWRTFSPKKLKSLTASSGTCEYDPKVYTDCVNQINQIQAITITFPDRSTIVFYGWLDKFTPKDIKEGDPPLADFTIQPANMDTTGAEIAPVYTAASSTSATTTTTL